MKNQKGVVKKLFIKKESKMPMEEVERLNIVDGLIFGQKKFQAMRSVLLSSSKLVDMWNIQAGDFRENIFVDNFDIFSLESGDVVKVGEINIRITFYCEPCKNMSHIGDITSLDKKRGVLGEFINDGVINVGDEFTIVEKGKYENIPYDYKERIAWYLENKVVDKIKASDLLYNCGVFPSLIRVLPQIMEKCNMKNRDKVIFVTHL